MILLHEGILLRKPIQQKLTKNYLGLVNNRGDVEIQENPLKTSHDYLQWKMDVMKELHFRIEDDGNTIRFWDEPDNIQLSSVKYFFPKIKYYILPPHYLKLRLNESILRRPLKIKAEGNDAYLGLIDDDGNIEVLNDKGKKMHYELKWNLPSYRCLRFRIAHNNIQFWERPSELQIESLKYYFPFIKSFTLPPHRKSQKIRLNEGILRRPLKTFDPNFCYLGLIDDEGRIELQKDSVRGLKLHKDLSWNLNYNESIRFKIMDNDTIFIWEAPNQLQKESLKYYFPGRRIEMPSTVLLKQKKTLGEGMVRRPLNLDPKVYYLGLIDDDGNLEIQNVTGHHNINHSELHWKLNPIRDFRIRVHNRKVSYWYDPDEIQKDAIKYFFPGHTHGKFIGMYHDIWNGQEDDDIDF